MCYNLIEPLLVFSMTTQIHTWFPTSIYVSEDIIRDEENKKLLELSMSITEKITNGGENWRCNMYNTLETYDLKNDIRFHDLINTVTDHVNNFAKLFETTNSYFCNSSWINIGKKNTYQEYHTHANSVFSAVYYLSVPEGSGKIVFENPSEPDMCGITNIQKQNDFNHKTCHYLPLPKTLIIFRSYLRHMVEIGNNETPRVTLAFNFS